jgi:hypothetical protein
MISFSSIFKNKVSYAAWKADKDTEVFRDCVYNDEDGEVCEKYYFAVNHRERRVIMYYNKAFDWNVLFSGTFNNGYILVNRIYYRFFDDGVVTRTVEKFIDQIDFENLSDCFKFIAESLQMTIIPEPAEVTKRWKNPEKMVRSLIETVYC